MCTKPIKHSVLNSKISFEVPIFLKYHNNLKNLPIFFRQHSVISNQLVIFSSNFAAFSEYTKFMILSTRIFWPHRQDAVTIPLQLTNNQFWNGASSEMFFQRLAWKVIVELFTVCILLDQALFGEYDNHVITNNFNGSSYDFIIGENSQIYCCLIICAISQGHMYTKSY